MKTAEEYWAYKFFTKDAAAEQAQSSEIFTAYHNAELQRESEFVEQAKLEAKEDEKTAFAIFSELQEKINKSSDLKNYLRKVKNYIDSNPKFAESVDKNFLNGLNMLNLGE